MKLIFIIILAIGTFTFACSGLKSRQNISTPFSSKNSQDSSVNEIQVMDTLKNSTASPSYNGALIKTIPSHRRAQPRSIEKL